MKILITGGSGLLGQYLNIRLAANHEILTAYRTETGNCTNYNSVMLDINYNEKLEETVKNFSPDIVIHCAAVSTPAKAQNLPPKLVYGTNVNATRNLACLCRDYNAKLIYISTDLVYAGYRGSMLKEDSKIIPVSIYAETKLMGEVKIKESFDNYLILRTALLYGFGLNGRENHFHRIYKTLKKGKSVKLFKDQFRTPVSLNDSARIISELCEKDIKGDVINLGGPERISRLELGYKLCEAAGFDKNLVESISMNDLPDYPQVADVSLNTEKLRALEIRQKTIDESIAEILQLDTK